MQFVKHEIDDVTKTAWETMLGLRVTADLEPMVTSAQDHTVAASVQITGGWNGAVVLFCPAALARQVASVMFAIDEREASADQVQDALGELANIISGGVKGLLPGECHLSLPTVADGTVYTLRVRGSHVVLEAAFACDGHQFKLSLLAHDESGVVTASGATDEIAASDAVSSTGAK